MNSIINVAQMKKLLSLLILPAIIFLFSACDNNSSKGGYFPSTGEPGTVAAAGDSGSTGGTGNEDSLPGDTTEPVAADDSGSGAPGDEGSTNPVSPGLVSFPSYEWPVHSEFEGPEIHITEVEQGPRLMIKGYLEDQDGVAYLRVNGNPVSLDRNQFNQYCFSLSMADAYEITFTAFDEDGNSNSILYRRTDQDTIYPFKLRMNSSALPLVSNVVEDLFMTMDVTALLKQFCPIEECFCILPSFFGCLLKICAKVDVMKASFGKPDVTIDTTGSGQMKIYADVPNLDVRVKIFGSLIPAVYGDFKGSISIDALGDADVIGNSINISVPDINTRINNYDLKVLGFIRVDLIPFLNTFIKNYIEDVLARQFKEKIPAFMESAVNSLSIGVIASYDERSINIEAAPSEIWVNPDNIDLTLNSSVGPHSPVIAPTALGVPQVDSSCTLENENPPVGSSYDAHCYVPVNLLNQALYAAYQSGMVFINGTVTDDLINEVLKKILILQFIPEEIVSAVVGLLPEIQYSVMPAGPPTVRMEKDGKGLARISLYDLEVYIKMNGESMPDIPLLSSLFGSSDLTLGVTLDASAPIDFDISCIDPDSAAALENHIDIDVVINSQIMDPFLDFAGIIDSEKKNFLTVVPVFGELPIVQIKGISINGRGINIPVPAFDANALGLPEDLNESMTKVINDMMPVVTEIIGAIPIPSIMGYSMNVHEMWVPENAQNFIGIGADLIKIQQ